MSLLFYSPPPLVRHFFSPLRLSRSGQGSTYFFVWRDKCHGISLKGFCLWHAPFLEPLRLQRVWSLPQFYSVDFSQSRIGVKKYVFNQHTIKVCVTCFWRCLGTSVPSAAHLTVSLYLCSSGSNARGEWRALEGRCVSLKALQGVRD